MTATRPAVTRPARPPAGRRPGQRRTQHGDLERTADHRRPRAVALLAPRRALLKEWAYAGAFFTYSGAIASHLTTGYALGELGLLAALTALTAVSWALRPPSRRAHRVSAP